MSSMTAAQTTSTRFRMLNSMTRLSIRLLPHLCQELVRAARDNLLPRLHAGFDDDLVPERRANLHDSKFVGVLGLRDEDHLLSSSLLQRFDGHRNRRSARVRI